jgi:hypothetical protein
MNLTWAGFGNTGVEKFRETIRTLSAFSYTTREDRTYRESTVSGSATDFQNLNIPCTQAQCQQPPLGGTIQSIKEGTLSRQGK